MQLFTHTLASTNACFSYPQLKLEYEVVTYLIFVYMQFISRLKTNADVNS